jgi:YVTN family beta-propeller protein
MGRRRFAISTLALALIALAALPGLASARVAYFTGSAGGMGAIAAPVELSTQTADPADQITISMASEGSPPDVAIAPDGKTAYVIAGNFPTGVVPIDVATNAPKPLIPVDQFPRSIAITPDGRFAYVTSSFSSTDVVSKIDLATNTVVAKIPVGDNLFGIAVSADGRTVYVVSSNDDAVFPIDVATNAVGAAILVGPFPSAVAVTPDGTSVYVLVPSEEKLVRINTATNTVVGSIPNVGGFELAIAPDSAKAYTAGSSEATPVDLAAGAAGAPIATSGQDSFEDVAFLPDGSRAYLTTQHFEMSNFEGLMTPIVTAGDTPQATFPLNSPGVQALAIVPNQPPRAAFSSAPAPAKVQQPVSFDAGASADTDGGSVARYEWDFGDGTVVTSGGAKPQHTYAKPGTYQVTLTTTDNEGCSVSIVFPGQTAYCNGSGIARVTHPVVVGTNICPSVKAKASTFIPKRRPGKVLPGVRVRVSTGVPSRLTVTATLLYELDDKPASAGLGTIKVDVNKWRRVRFALPPELRQMLPVGTPVKVAVRIESSPRGGVPCEASVTNRNLKVHVVKVFPNRVQAQRPR